MSASIDWFGLNHPLCGVLSNPKWPIALGKYGQIPLAGAGLVRDGPIESIEDASTPQSWSAILGTGLILR